MQMKFILWWWLSRNEICQMQHCIALLYFGLLRAGEVRMIQVEDVMMTDNEQIKRLHINFAYPWKRCNTGMDYYFPVDFLPVFKTYISEISQASVKQGRLQFLKNWSAKGKHRLQNTGKHTINKLHKVAFEILKLRPDDYGSHLWQSTAATVLADAGVSKVKIKRPGQWASNTMVEGYIANSNHCAWNALTASYLKVRGKRKRWGRK